MTPRPHRRHLVPSATALLLSLAVGGTTAAQDALDAQVDEVIAQVEEVRGMERTEDIEWQLSTADDALARQLAAITEDTEIVERTEQDEALAIRLGLLPPGTDLLQLSIDTLQGQVAGFYDSDTRQLTVIDDDGALDLASRITLAHEAQHALQDQRWDLDALRDPIPLEEGDRMLALQALIEGDASLLMTLWAAKHAAGDLGAMGTAGLPGGESIEGLPQVLQRQLLFPYLDGLTFLFGAWGREGWAGVDRIWDAPPVSTEQIMHPERYPDELPVPVTLPDLARALGDGWTVTGETVMGELMTSVWVADGADWDPLAFTLGGITMPNADAADGWGGDRLVTLDGPDGSWVVVWQTTWDTPEDAVEFQAAAEAAMADLPGSWTVEPIDGTGGGLPNPVQVLVADSDSTLDLLGDASATVTAGA